MYVLRPGDVLLTNNRDLHRPLVSKGKVYERYVIWMQQEYIDSITKNGDRVTACFEDSAQKHYKMIRPSNELQAFLRRLCVKLEVTNDSTEYGHAILQNAYMVVSFLDKKSRKPLNESALFGILIGFFGVFVSRLFVLAPGTVMTVSAQGFAYSNIILNRYQTLNPQRITTDTQMLWKANTTPLITVHHPFLIIPSPEYLNACSLSHHYVMPVSMVSFYQAEMSVPLHIENNIDIL